jgi:hypothetical protein
MGPHLPPLDAAQLETLLAALDPQLEGFGGGDSWLADARAYLARLRGDDGPDGPHTALQVWLDAWQQVEGNRQTLQLAITALLELIRRRA